MRDVLCLNIYIAYFSKTCSILWYFDIQADDIVLYLKIVLRSNAIWNTFIVNYTINIVNFMAAF